MRVAVDVSSVRVKKKRWYILAFAIIYQAHRDVFKRSTKVEIRERLRTSEDERQR